MDSKRPVLIIGASRSGTSLLARILESSGIFMGADLESNHESRSIQAANRWVYLNADASFESPGEAMANLFADAFLRQAVVDVLASRVRGRSAWRYWGRRLVTQPTAWGFKDPRLTFTLPLWLEVLPEAHVIHMRRDGVSAAHSLQMRRQRAEARWQADPHGSRLIAQHRVVANNFASDLVRCHTHWQQYAWMAGQHVKQLGRERAIEVEYDTLMRYPEATLARVGVLLAHPMRAWQPTTTPDGVRLAPAEA